MLHPPHYDPLQPRVPKGHEGGGRWTRQHDGWIQLASARELVLKGQAAGAAARDSLSKAIAATFTFFAWLSARNNAQQQAVVEFRAREFHANNGFIVMTRPRVLTREQVKEVCTKIDRVQELTDEATQTVDAAKLPLSASQYGTAVHHKLKLLIDKKGKKEGLWAEVSILKTIEETDYGEPGSIRIDIYEPRSRKTVCVYDIKTGKSILGPLRMSEIALKIFAAYPDVQYIIVTEIRPQKTSTPARK